MKIVLIGMMGSGKTTVGKILAEKLLCNFYDTDAFIESEAQMPIAKIFESQGEPEFRRLEQQVIKKLIQQNVCVIATGGGAPCTSENWEALSKNSTIVWLKSSPKKILERLKLEKPGTRPLLKGNALSIDQINSILKSRIHHYQKAPISIDVDPLSPTQVVESILKLVFPRKRNPS